MSDSFDYPRPSEPSAVPPNALAAPPSAYAATPAYGAQPSSTSHNWQGVVSLVLSLTGFGLFGIILGILGISSANKGKADNKGVAIAGLIISSLSTLVVAGVIVGTIVSDGTEAIFNSTDEVAVGQCFNETGDAGRAIADGDTYTVSGYVVIDCDKPHYGQVYFAGDLPDTPYPGEDEVFEDVSYRCGAVWDEHVDASEFADLNLTVTFPLARHYMLDDREYKCMVVAVDDTDLYRSYVYESPDDSTAAVEDAQQQEVVDERAQVELVAVGDCFDETTVPRPRGIDDIGGYVLLDCDSAHEAEVYYSGRLPGGTYMGEYEAAEYVSQQCEEQFAAHVRDGGPEGWRVSYYFNDALMFSNGKSNFECAVRSADGPLVGSWVVAG